MYKPLENIIESLRDNIETPYRLAHEIVMCCAREVGQDNSTTKLESLSKVYDILTGDLEKFDRIHDISSNVQCFLNEHNGAKEKQLIYQILCYFKEKFFFLLKKRGSVRAIMNGYEALIGKTPSYDIFKRLDGAYEEWDSLVSETFAINRGFIRTLEEMFPLVFGIKEVQFRAPSGA